MPIACKSLACMVKRILPNTGVSVVETGEETQYCNSYFPLCQFALQGQGQCSHCLAQRTALYILDTPVHSPLDFLLQWLTHCLFFTCGCLFQLSAKVVVDVGNLI